MRVEFTNRTTTEAVSVALFRTQAQADAFAHTSWRVRTGGLFRTQVALVGRFVFDAAAATQAKAKALITFATAQLQRSEH